MNSFSFRIDLFSSVTVDSVEDDANLSRRRRGVSFICYLNERGWAPTDGGALRVYLRDHIKSTEEGVSLPDQSPAHFDIMPEGGTLVLFDSKRVWHEVMPTKRERACLVGWFREEGI